MRRKNQAWVGDITYIKLLREFVYLAAILDLFSRRCIGWAVSRNPDAQLTLGALNKAIALRGAANVAGCIYHSDQGVQYAAAPYVKRLEEVYNKKRLHSSLGYMPPIEFEEKKKEVLNTSIQA